MKTKARKQSPKPPLKRKSLESVRIKNQLKSQGKDFSANSKRQQRKIKSRLDRLRQKLSQRTEQITRSIELQKRQIKSQRRQSLQDRLKRRLVVRPNSPNYPKKLFHKMKNIRVKHIRDFVKRPLESSTDVIQKTEQKVGSKENYQQNRGLSLSQVVKAKQPKSKSIKSRQNFFQKITKKVKNEKFINKLLAGSKQKPPQKKHALLEKVHAFLRTLGVGKFDVMALEQLEDLLEKKESVPKQIKREVTSLFLVLCCLMLQKLQDIDPKAMVESGQIRLETVLRKQDFQKNVRFFVTKLNEFDWVQISKSMQDAPSAFTGYIARLRRIFELRDWTQQPIDGPVLQNLTRLIRDGLPDSVKNVKEIRWTIKKMIQYLSLLGLDPPATDPGKRPAKKNPGQSSNRQSLARAMEFVEEFCFKEQTLDEIKTKFNNEGIMLRQAKLAVVNNNEITAMVPKEAFLEQHEKFQKLSKLKFFKVFRKRKNFLVWTFSVTRNRFLYLQSKLDSNFLYKNRFFGGFNESVSQVLSTLHSQVSLFYQSSQITLDVCTLNQAPRPLGILENANREIESLKFHLNVTLQAELEKYSDYVDQFRPKDNSFLKKKNEYIHLGFKELHREFVNKNRFFKENLSLTGSTHSQQFKLLKLVINTNKLVNSHQYEAPEKAPRPKAGQLHVLERFFLRKCRYKESVREGFRQQFTGRIQPNLKVFKKDTALFQRFLQKYNEVLHRFEVLIQNKEIFSAKESSRKKFHLLMDELVQINSSEHFYKLFCYFEVYSHFLRIYRQFSYKKVSFVIDLCNDQVDQFLGLLKSKHARNLTFIFLELTDETLDNLHFLQSRPVDQLFRPSTRTVQAALRGLVMRVMETLFTVVAESPVSGSRDVFGAEYSNILHEFAKGRQSFADTHQSLLEYTQSFDFRDKVSLDFKNIYQRVIRRDYFSELDRLVSDSMQMFMDHFRRTRSDFNIGFLWLPDDLDRIELGVLREKIDEIAQNRDWRDDLRRFENVGIFGMKMNELIQKLQRVYSQNLIVLQEHYVRGLNRVSAERCGQIDAFVKKTHKLKMDLNQILESKQNIERGNDLQLECSRLIQVESVWVEQSELTHLSNANLEPFFKVFVLKNAAFKETLLQEKKKFDLALEEARAEKPNLEKTFFQGMALLQKQTDAFLQKFGSSGTLTYDILDRLQEDCQGLYLEQDRLTHIYRRLKMLDQLFGESSLSEINLDPSLIFNVNKLLVNLNSLMGKVHIDEPLDFNSIDSFIQIIRSTFHLLERDLHVEELLSYFFSSRELLRSMLKLFLLAKLVDQGALAKAKILRIYEYLDRQQKVSAEVLRHLDEFFRDSDRQPTLHDLYRIELSTHFLEIIWFCVNTRNEERLGDKLVLLPHFEKMSRVLFPLNLERLQIISEKVARFRRQIELNTAEVLLLLNQSQMVSEQLLAKHTKFSEVKNLTVDILEKISRITREMRIYFVLKSDEKEARMLSCEKQLKKVHFSIIDKKTGNLVRKSPAQLREILAKLSKLEDAISFIDDHIASLLDQQPLLLRLPREKLRVFLLLPEERPETWVFYIKQMFPCISWFGIEAMESEKTLSKHIRLVSGEMLLVRTPTFFEDKLDLISVLENALSQSVFEFRSQISEVVLHKLGGLNSMSLMQQALELPLFAGVEFIHLLCSFFFTHFLTNFEAKAKELLLAQLDNYLLILQKVRIKIFLIKSKSDFSRKNIEDYIKANKRSRGHNAKFGMDAGLKLFLGFTEKPDAPDNSRWAEFTQQYTDFSNVDTQVKKVEAFLLFFKDYRSILANLDQGLDEHSFETLSIPRVISNQRTKRFELKFLDFSTILPNAVTVFNDSYTLPQSKSFYSEYNGKVVNLKTKTEFIRSAFVPFSLSQKYLLNMYLSLYSGPGFVLKSTSLPVAETVAYLANRFSVELLPLDCHDDDATSSAVELFKRKKFLMHLKITPRLKELPQCLPDLLDSLMAIPLGVGPIPQSLGCPNEFKSSQVIISLNQKPKLRLPSYFEKIHKRFRVVSLEQPDISELLRIKLVSLGFRFVESLSSLILLLIFEIKKRVQNVDLFQYYAVQFPRFLHLKELYSTSFYFTPYFIEKNKVLNSISLTNEKQILGFLLLKFEKDFGFQRLLILKFVRKIFKISPENEAELSGLVKAKNRFDFDEAHLGSKLKKFLLASPESGTSMFYAPAEDQFVMCPSVFDSFLNRKLNIETVQSFYVNLLLKGTLTRLQEAGLEEAQERPEHAPPFDREPRDRQCPPEEVQAQPGPPEPQKAEEEQAQVAFQDRLAQGRGERDALPQSEAAAQLPVVPQSRGALRDESVGQVLPPGLREPAAQLVEPGLLRLRLAVPGLLDGPGVPPNRGPLPGVRREGNQRLRPAPLEEVAVGGLRGRLLVLRSRQVPPSLLEAPEQGQEQVLVFLRKRPAEQSEPLEARAVLAGAGDLRLPALPESYPLQAGAAAEAVHLQTQEVQGGRPQPAEAGQEHLRLLRGPARAGGSLTRSASTG